MLKKIFAEFDTKYIFRGTTPPKKKKALKIKIYHKSSKFKKINTRKHFTAINANYMTKLLIKCFQ